MCLDRLSDFKVRLNKNGEGWGYKAFRVRRSDGALIGEFARKNKARRLNEWLNEKDFRPTELEYENMIKMQKYGWRIFLSKKALEKWLGKYIKHYKIVGLKFRGIVATGVWGGKWAWDSLLDGKTYKEVIVSEIYIPKKET